jgi:hypothetical protein
MTTPPEDFVGAQNIESDTLLAPPSEPQPQKGFQNETLQRQIRNNMGKTFRHFYHMPNLINIEPPEMEKPKSPRSHSIPDGDIK